MTDLRGKDLLLATLRHETTERVPWVPFAGVHAGKLRGYSAEEVLKDPDKLFEALLEVNRVYDPDGQPVLFDLQIEAEILGCELVWGEKAPPSVASHPLADDPTPPDYLPEATDGRIPLALEVMRRMKAAVGEHTALYGLICGPLTLASHLRGTELFMDIMLNPGAVTALIAYTTAVCKRMSDLYIAAGMDVIAVVDPMVSQIGPRHFTPFLSGPFTDLFAHIRGRRRVLVPLRLWRRDQEYRGHVPDRARLDFGGREYRPASGQGHHRPLFDCPRRQHPADDAHADGQPAGQHEVGRRLAGPHDRVQPDPRAGLRHAL